MEKSNIAVVGLGIAGGILAWELNKRGHSVTVFNEKEINSSSRVAAGLVNGIIPRRVTKTWMADEIFPALHSFYPALEEELKVQFFHRSELIHIFEHSKEQNDWLRKIQNSKFEDFFSSKDLFYPENKHLKAPLGSIKIDQAGHCDTALFLDTLENYFSDNNMLVPVKFDYEKLVHHEGSKFEYDGTVYDKVVFAEGIHAEDHPYFSEIQFSPVKGELLKVKSKEFKLDKILLGGVFVIPLKNDEYYIGATYEWDYNDVLPTEKGKEKLLKRFSDYSDVSLEVLEQRAGVRPAIKDRRPVIGEHNHYYNMYVFNGFGSKAVSLVPYFANHFCDYLFENKSLNTEVEYSRFLK
jgi:glycine oxidase